MVGVKIEDNTPLIEGDGTFKINPKLVLGLNIDKNTGIISGIPEEQYEGNFTVIFTNKDTADILSCNLYITGIFILIFIVFDIYSVG